MNQTNIDDKITLLMELCGEFELSENKSETFQAVAAILDIRQEIVNYIATLEENVPKTTMSRILKDFEISDEGGVDETMDD